MYIHHFIIFQLISQSCYIEIKVAQFFYFLSCQILKFFPCLDLLLVPPSLTTMTTNSTRNQISFEFDMLKHVLPADKIISFENDLITFFTVNWEPSVPLPTPSSPLITHSWPFVPMIEALLPILIYTFIVLIGCLIIKKDRKILPSNIIYTIKFTYNFTQIFLCSYMFIETCILASRNNYNPYILPFFGKDQCNKFDTINPKIANIAWIFYISKILDFMDTILIIVSGKIEQFTFLHCYHHLSIFTFWWINISMSFDGDIYVVIMFNSFIHSIMYTYYLLSMHVDSKNIWWKKYLTKLQLIQFCIFILHGILEVFWDCNENPPRTLILYLVYVVSMIILFARFYKKAYNKKHSRNSRDQNRNRNTNNNNNNNNKTNKNNKTSKNKNKRKTN